MNNDNVRQAVLGNPVSLEEQEELDLSSGPVEKVAPARDAIVKVSAGSIVYVLQDNERLRFYMVWAHEQAGEVLVPLRALDDGSGPLTIGLQTGDTSKPDDMGNMKGCPECMSAAFVKCCM